MRFAGLCALAAATSFAASAIAGEPGSGSASASSKTGAYALKNTSALFLGAEFLGSVVIFAAYSSAAGDPATVCGWCGTNGFDTSMRKLLKMDNPRTPATLSHVFSVGVTPAIALAGSIIPALSHGHGWFPVQDGVVMLNTLILTAGLADGTKKFADRQRPAFHYGLEAETEARTTPEEEYLSFFSGDTALAFNFAASGATLAYLRGYKSAPYVAIGAGASALAAGILRVSADMHWTSDVLVGALVGSAVGFSVPFFLHQRDRSVPPLAIAPSITRDHAMLIVSGAF